MARRSRGGLLASPWLLGAALAAFALLGGKAREIHAAIVAGTRKIVDEINKMIFKAQLPARARPYGDLILRVADEKNVDPFILFAIGDRETNWGTAPQYKQQTGDWGAREKPLSYVQTLGGIVKITSTRVLNNVTYATYIPIDDLGWGRGIAQIDWEMQRNWLRSNNWRDDYTVLSYAATIYKNDLTYFASIPNPLPVNVQPWQAARLNASPGRYKDPRPLVGPKLVAAALAAYNAGRGNVLAALAVGAPADALTTPKKAGLPGDYATDTLARADGLAAAFAQAGGRAETAGLV